MKDISVLDFSKTYTYADYLTWQFQERVELIKGKLFRMSPAPKRMHQEVSFNLSKALIPYFENNPCKVYYAPFDVRFPSGDTKTYTVVQPDICVVCDLAKLDEAGCVGAPDLIIEILSESTAKKDYRDKYDLYEAEGVKEYWIASPNGFIEVFVLEQKKFEAKGKFFTGDVLSSDWFKGLSVDLSKIFTS